MPTTAGGFEQSVYVLTSVANIAAITAAEITAGVEIHDDMPDPVNFSGTTNYMDTSVISSRQDLSESGTYTPDEIAFDIFRRKTGGVALAALDDETAYYLVKFEGGNIAAGNHATPAAGDTYDAVQITVGTKSDASTGRSDPRRISVPSGVTGFITRDGTLA